MGTDQRSKNYLKSSTLGKVKTAAVLQLTQGWRACLFFSDHSSPSSSSTLCLAVKQEHENHFFSLYGLKMCASQKCFLREDAEEVTRPPPKPTQSIVAASTKPCASEYDYSSSVDI